MGSLDPILPKNEKVPESDAIDNFPGLEALEERKAQLEDHAIQHSTDKKGDHKKLIELPKSKINPNWKYGIDPALISFASGRTACEILNAMYNELDLLQDAERTGSLTPELTRHLRDSLDKDEGTRFVRTKAVTYEECYTGQENMDICKALLGMINGSLQYSTLAHI
jgi:hypothetical protein